MKITYLWVLELIVIGLIPLSTIFYEFYENTPYYKSFFKFDLIENSIVNRFGSNHELINNQQEIKNILNKNLAPEEFHEVWQLIKDHTMIKLRDEEPKLISTLAVSGAPSTNLPTGQYLLIPDSVPLIISYCEESEVAQGICKDVVVVGTAQDFKDWYSEKKTFYRNMVNLVLGVLALILGLILSIFERKRRIEVEDGNLI